MQPLKQHSKAQAMTWSIYKAKKLTNIIAQLNKGEELATPDLALVLIELETARMKYIKEHLAENNII